MISFSLPVPLVTINSEQNNRKTDQRVVCAHLRLCFIQKRSETSCLVWCKYSCSARNRSEALDCDRRGLSLDSGTRSSTSKVSFINHIGNTNRLSMGRAGLGSPGVAESHMRIRFPDDKWLHILYSINAGGQKNREQNWKKERPTEWY